MITEGTQTTWQVDATDLTIEVVAPHGLSISDWSDVHGVFARCYRGADNRYLDLECRDKLGSLIVARRDGSIVAFNFCDVRRMDLPGLPDQIVSWIGLGCVDPEQRRIGTMRTMLAAQLMYVTGPVLREGESTLFGARNATPASFNLKRALPGLVPAPDAGLPNEWHREVASAICSAFGILRFDPATFVCVGPGRSIGELDLEIDATDDVRALFDSVDRSRGDTLLTLWWIGAAPAGW